MKDKPVILERKIIDSKNVESVIKVGKNTIHLNSTCGGKKQYSDILGRIIENKINQMNLE